MFLQPYARDAIVRLRDSPPSLVDPVELYLSTTDDLSTVRYSAEIVGWEDKSQIPDGRRRVITRLIYVLQPTEAGLYNNSGDGSGQSTNLLHIRRLRRVAQPFGVEKMTKTSDRTPVSPNRSTSGGWSYVDRVEP
jgi:5-methylcytosine-specific restriction enzyme A